jgi:hypothetical protein
MKVTGRKDTFLELFKELVIIMLEYHSRSPIASGPKNANLSGAKYNGLNHWIFGTLENKNSKTSSGGTANSAAWRAEKK